MSRGILLFGVLAIGCQEYEIKETTGGLDDLSDEGAPDIEVNPEVINFQDLDAAAGLEAQEIVIVSNVGTVDLHINDLYVDDEAGPFSINAISSPLIPPNGQAQFAVTFGPETAANNIGYVYIDSDDPDTPVAEVQLNGVGIAPVIDVNPGTYDFGMLYVGCDSSQALTISNIGTADLLVDSFSWSTASTDLSFDALEALNGPLPWTIAPSDSKEVFVDYSPMDENNDASFLTIASNDPYLPDGLLVTQEGWGEIFGENSDVFEQPIQGSTDIIFAVDRSCSMFEELESVTSNFETFVDYLDTMDSDYHVAAVVGDDGCVYGPDKFIDSSFTSSQAQATITTMIDCYYAQTQTTYNCTLNVPYGSNTEMAFMLMEKFLEESVDQYGTPDPSGCNYGVVREDAKLALVGISDEPEQSINSYSHYISLFQSLKSNPDDVIIHAIGGDYPSGCGFNEAYTGMYEATVATGGLFLSICANDWGAHLEALAEGSAQDLTSFELTEWPVPETIVVKIDSVTSAVGWSYNPTDNAIDFVTDYVPEGGQTIQVDYAIYGDCDQ
jgi:hypothetical protein